MKITWDPRWWSIFISHPLYNFPGIPLDYADYHFIGSVNLSKTSVKSIICRCVSNFNNDILMCIFFLNEYRLFLVELRENFAQIDNLVYFVIERSILFVFFKKKCKKIDWGEGILNMRHLYSSSKEMQAGRLGYF